MSEIALWRAVIQQAVADSRIVPDPLPELPCLPPLEELKAMPVERHRELKKTRLRLLHVRLRVLEARRAKAEAIAWFRDAGSDFKRVCEWAGLEPAYVSRKAKENNGLGVCLP